MQDVHTLVAGDSLNFTTRVDGYLATDGWTLHYRIVPRFAQPVQAPVGFTATPLDDTTHQVQVASSATANWAPGLYGWASWMQNGIQRVTLEQGGELTVAPNPATIAQGVDTRGPAAIALANVNAVLTKTAARGVAELTINGRQLKNYSIPELLKLKAHLEDEVRKERKAAGLETTGGRRRILLRCA